MAQNLSRRKFSFRRTWLLLPIDALIVVVAYVLSFQLRFSWHIRSEYIESFWDFSALSLMIYVVAFLSMRLYTRIWRYANVRDMEALAIACTSSAVLVKAIDLVASKVVLPLSVWLSSYLLTMVLVAFVRISIRTYYQPRQLSKKRKGLVGTKVLIFGAGSAGSIVAREAVKDVLKPWSIVGFVDDDEAKRGLTLNGFRVLGARHDLPEITRLHQIERIVIAIPSMSRDDLRAVVDDLNVYGIPILIIPPYTRWGMGDLYSQVRPVDVEDLLGREPLPVDVSVVGSYVEGARVLVTGAGGSIGSEICRQVAALHPQELILLGRGENSIFDIHSELDHKYNDVRTSVVIADIRDERKMAHVFRTMRPNVVYHAAAHKHVPLMEQHPDEAYLNNVIGTKLLAQLSDHHQVDRFILISSDKAVRPANVMGSSKRIAEMVIQEQAERSSHTEYIAVRFGNVLGSRGSVVPIFRKQIAEGGPVTVTDERMTRYFMTIPESVRLVIEAGAVGASGHVYLFDMGEPVRIVDLAKRMIQLSGFKPEVDIHIVFTGVRPGEKLYEELIRESDAFAADPNGRIWSVSCPTMNSASFNVALSQLHSLYQEGAFEELSREMKHLAWWEPAFEKEVAVSSEAIVTQIIGID